MTHGISLRCILFDLDGTLLDTAADLSAALNRALGEEGYEQVFLDESRPWVSHGAPGMVRNALGSSEHPGYKRVLDRMIGHYGRNLAVQTSLFDGMESVLDRIEACGLTWGIVTNKRSGFSEPLLESLHLAERAACIISGDTTKNKKPHPEPLFEACRRIGAEPGECIYVGDAQKDIQAGTDAGMRTLVATYGYLSADDDAKDWGATGLLQHPLDLLNWIGPN